MPDNPIALSANGPKDGPLLSAPSTPVVRGAAAPQTGPVLGVSQAALSAARALGEKVVRLSDIPSSFSMPYLVKGWFYLQQTSLLFAPSNAGKTSLVLDLVRALVSDVDWHGYRTARGAGVLYIAAEAPGSVYRRTAMLAMEGKERVAVLGEAVDIVGDPLAGEKIAALAQHCARKFRIAIKLVVLDTLTLCFGEGDENSTRDAGRAVEAAKIAARLANAHTMLVHHTGKDRSAGARGSYALEANVDTIVELAVLDPDRKLVHAKLRKQRDAPTSPAFAFKVVSVDLGDDEDGDPITTSAVQVVSDFGIAEAGPKPKTDTGVEAVLDALLALSRSNPSAPGFTAAEVAEACAATFKPNAETESRKKAVRGVLRQVMSVSGSPIEKEGDRYRLVLPAIATAA